MQTARQRGADVLLICEQYKKPEFSDWFQDASRRSGINIFNPNLTVGNFLETDKGFVWAEVAGVRIDSSYFSLNDPFEKFDSEIRSLKESLRTFGGDVLIAGDFNSKSPEWGETRRDRRGILVSDMVSAGQLAVLNRGNKFTFRRGISGSILDLTIASPCLARRVKEWKVLDEVTMSDHQYIEFLVSEENSKGSSGPYIKDKKRPSRNLKRLNRERLAQSLVESRCFRELGWVAGPVTLKGIVREARQIIVDACNYSMPRQQHRRTRKGVLYWWDNELARLRKECNASRRRYTYSKGDLLLQEEWHTARRIFKRAIRSSQQRCWKDLIGKSKKDLWGLAFKIVTKKLVSKQKTPGLDDPHWVRKIIKALFCQVEPAPREDHTLCVVQEEELFTLDELRRVSKGLRSGKAPGRDGIPSEILKEVIRPICLLDTMGKFLERLQKFLVGENSLSENQFGFRKGRSTVDAILTVVNQAKKAKEGKKKGFCALVSIDIRNAFNSAR
ncbi:uncharacterized protein LOC122510602 [Leptopilina heterotoma]|uniref:uncharacterized protein LOC122510602 n=1 Tax=Leptopilina heterotoma TaxID=63436 RepID=UPI001CA9DED1|nr:uncharacterized protein LOC122510602 [Leptopilina heterotoma]